MIYLMHDLTKHWNCLSLSEREGDDIGIKRDHCSTEHLIAAFFLQASSQHGCSGEDI